MGNRKAKANYRRTVLRLPDLDHSKAAVLNSLTSPGSRRVYRYAIEQFIAWYCSEPRLAFNRIVVVRYRMYLEGRGLAANTINQQLAAVRQSPGPARLTRPTDAEDSRTDARVGRDRGEASRGSTTADASRSRAADRLSFRTRHWDPGAFPLRQANRQLCRAGSSGGVQRGSETTRAHQQTRQLSAALPAGGSSPGHGTQPSAVAQPVFPSGHAARAKDREGRDGPETCGAVVLDVAARMESRRNAQARFARGRARKSPWCAVITDVMIGYPAPPFAGSSKQ
jgi:hypothetical protein